MVQTLSRCRECGLPGRLAESVAWGPGGLVVLRRMQGMRLAMLDERTLESVKAAMSGAVGAAAVQEAQRDAANAAASTQMRAKGRLSRFGTAKREFLVRLEELSLLLGLGRVELEKFTPCEGGSMLLRMPFDLEMMAAAITGALERMDQCVYAVEVSGIGENVFRLALEAKGRSEDNALKRVHAVSHGRIDAGGGDGERCGQCGLPVCLAGLCWDEMHGVIRAGADGRRLVLLPHCMLAAQEHLVEAPAGVAASMQEAVFRSVRAGMEYGEHDGYEKALNGGKAGSEGWCGSVGGMLAMRGWGALAGIASEGDRWRIEVMNPVSDGLVAGWLRALYTVAVGREPLVTASGDASLRLYEMG
ncbi:MAG: hypothetical protein PHP28_07180 [Actinomycetota bacterium]|nr:hypothetical protein [Actinomycetota bacterium]MDD5666016.1 hypothetical protein [Actinomycetota bacterium]